MTTGSDFADATETIREYVNLIGDDIQNEFVQDSSGGEIVVGFKASHGSYYYNVVGDPGTHYFRIEFPFHIPQDLGSLLTDDLAEQIVDDADDDGETAISTLAAYEILERMSDENKEKFQYELMNVLSSTDTGYEFSTTESGTIIGFDVTRRIFPWEDDFSLTEFNHSVQSVINSGHSAVQFVVTAFDFQELVESHTAGGSPEGTPRYLQ